MSIIQDLVNALNLDGLFQDEPGRDYETEQWMEQQRQQGEREHAAWKAEAAKEAKERQALDAEIAEYYVKSDGIPVRLVLLTAVITVAVFALLAVVL